MDSAAARCDVTARAIAPADADAVSLLDHPAWLSTLCAGNPQTFFIHLKNTPGLRPKSQARKTTEFAAAIAVAASAVSACGPPARELPVPRVQA